MRILGVDPGLRLTGYACLDMRPDVPHLQPSIVEAGVFRLRQGTSVSERLVELERDLQDLLDRVEPTHAAVEGLFAHYKRPTTAVAMGHARGVILLCLRRAGLEIAELKPTRVKKSLTGFGHASKAQVQSAVAAQLSLPAPPTPADVADAIAIALCAARSRAVTTYTPPR
ncbi:MAG: crossover junction endodeoxyribonuclease RuvC [Phycisphaerales bacterium]